jgi:anti-sigma-K factor RskA
MDHAEAHERIADLAIEPRRLVDLELDPSPEELDLLAHVAGCATCRAELDAWRRTHEAVLEAAITGGVATESQLDRGLSKGNLEPPADLRAAVAAIPGRSPRLLDPVDGAAAAPLVAAKRRRPARQVVALAAVIVVGLIIGLGAFAFDQTRHADLAQDQIKGLTALSTSVDRVLRDAGHTSVALIGLDGSPAGTAAWSSDEIVVITTALTPPGPGAEYRCWVDRDGKRTAIGVMRFADDIAYWWGPMGRYEDLPLDGGGTLGVSLELIGEDGGNAPILTGELPS